MAYRVPDSLLLPVAFLNREFDGKLLLALVAAERGLRPILGERRLIHERLPYLRRSIYLAKGVRWGNRMLFSQLERLGHTIAAIDEEALVRWPDDVFLMRFAPETFARIRMLFAWGEDNAAMWRRSKFSGDTPIVVSGNPRTDLLRPDLRSFHAREVDELHRRFGEFLLLNSNFSLVNHLVPGKKLFTTARWVDKQESDAARGGLQAHKRALLEQFLALVPALAEAIRPRNLIVRPHPSESHAVWVEAARGHANVHVLHEGPVVPWLAAAKAVIHNGCTSAVEAAVVGTPALAFRPVLSQEFDLPLPNALSVECPDAGTLIARARSALDGGPLGLTPDQRAILAHHVAGRDARLCCDRVVDALFENRGALARAPGTTLRRWIGGFLSHRRRQTRWERRSEDRREQAVMNAANKFPKSIALDWVEERIARFRRTLGRFDGLRARQLHRNIFSIERA